MCAVQRDLWPSRSVLACPRARTHAHTSYDHQSGDDLVVVVVVVVFGDAALRLCGCHRVRSSTIYHSSRERVSGKRSLPARRPLGLDGRSGVRHAWRANGARARAHQQVASEELQFL